MGTRSVYRNPGTPEQFLNKGADADRTAQRTERRPPSKEKFSMRTGRPRPLEVGNDGITDFLAKRQSALSVILSCPNPHASVAPVYIFDSQMNDFTSP